jgi:hypothetical protein
VRVGEHGRGRSLRVDEGSPGSREAEGEGGEGYIIARSGRWLGLLVVKGAELGVVDWILPVLFSLRSGDAEVGRGGPG